jgi:hypothetical protein
MSKKVIARVAVAMAVTATSLVVGAGTSQAAIDCTQYGTNKDAGFLYTIGAVPYRRGPGAACASVGNHEGQAAIWCSKYNPETGNLWYYARDISSNTVGWVWAGNVQRTEGSNHAMC